MTERMPNLNHQPPVYFSPFNAAVRSKHSTITKVPKVWLSTTVVQCFVHFLFLNLMQMQA